ncbi:tetratricopeptide repeat protein [Solwaraspora sp. WMMD1047]|uniref:ATP-binding protein n=1 Tax=Solwaraspora sp. WMMD1047 TaxID=3016102 RepID=UPI002415D88F|nr:tetratricopeptide repeat protein [Solwaraspora sp. WMMD1047]MDG4830657.1 tetratricopeptide repeat protein [Solwaraspora sp. WMMD1047]
MTMGAADELLRQYCQDLHTLWRQAGGPSLRTLGGSVRLSKSQVGAILSGQIRRPPDWDVVKSLVSAFHQYAMEHDRLRHVSLRMGVEEFWRPRHAIIEQAFRHRRPAVPAVATVDVGGPRPERSAVAGSTATAVPTAVPAPTAARRQVPRQLPPAVRYFTGRETELRALAGLLEQPADDVNAVVITSISGTAGVGKTALAVHWAHQVADRFPDGQLYVNLRGYHPEQPMDADEALTGFLTALGVPDQELPRDLEGRSARFRTELAGRRTLIVLDNASSVEQVRPLLPGTGQCLVVITSRDSLGGLVAVDGAQRLDLATLPLTDAAALLRRLIGRRAEVEIDAVQALARRCAHLPLALRVAAELAGRRAEAPLAELVAELADGQRRLDLLAAGGDPHAAVTAVFSWSMQHLPTAAARTFRLLGLHPGADVDSYAVAALTGTGLTAARDALDLLARAHLVHHTGTGRYGLHDLLRAYAASLTTALDDDRDQRAARDRLFDYYLAATAEAVAGLYPAEVTARPSVAPATTPSPELAEPHAAKQWLNTERSTLAAVARYTASHGWPNHTIRLSVLLYRYLDCGHYIDGLVVHQHALRAARQAGDLVGQAHALAGIGNTEQRVGRHESATEHLRQAIELFRRSGDVAGEANAQNSLGFLHFELARYDAAEDCFARALNLFRQTANLTGEALVRNNFGLLYRRLGRHEAAADDHRRALELARRTEDWTAEALALDCLGLVEQQLDRHRAAADHHHQALVLTRRYGSRRGEAHVLDNLGTAHIGLGDPGLAQRYFEQSLAIFTEIGEHGGRASALNGLGEAAHAAGRTTTALAHFAAALNAATVAGARYQQARAHTGLGHAHHTRGEPGRARYHYEYVVTHATDLDLAEAERIRSHVAALADHGPVNRTA